MLTTTPQAEMTTIANWPSFLAALDDYIAEHGHTRIAQDTTVPLKGQDYPLGREVNLARRQHAEGTLAKKHQAQLERRPQWRWDTRWNSRLDRWDSTADEISNHVKEHGNRALSPRLNEWLRRQRRAHHDGQLTDAQSARLGTIPGTLLDASGQPLDPTQVGRRSQVDQFIAAAQLWLAQNPGKTLADVTTATRVNLDDGKAMPLYKRVIYYRYRRAGREGTHPLSEQDAERIEQLPGWSWSGPRG
ncbi:helicase associated domain-containing protein [Ornithinimicrobium murale]|uniref:helicase associated domain-containing protein n=1 Tax=Ornithinimicrobium murale TaxID=1050153 RepID=UPI000E0D0393|nr:helicase associated domain-containing protein [Ornithinimicrobium murale]